MVWSPCCTSSPILSTKLSVTAEFSASGSPSPPSVGPTKASSSGKILSPAPTTARCRTNSFIGIVPPKPWRRRKIPTGWCLFGAHFALGCLERVWFRGLSCFIPLFSRLRRQLFHFCRWWFLYRPCPAGRCPLLLWRNTTATAAWARAPAGLCAAFPAWRWGALAPSNSTGRFSTCFWPRQLWNLLFRGFLLRWWSLCLCCLLIAWGPRKWSGPRGNRLFQRETRDRGSRGSILRKAWITGQIGWWGRHWRSLTPEKGDRKEWKYASQNTENSK